MKKYQWIIIPVVFSIFIITSCQDASAVIYVDTNSTKFIDSFYIQFEEEKTKENLIRYYNHVLDDSYSDEFIDAVSEYGFQTVNWSFFTEDNPNPLRFLRADNVHLPSTRGLSDIYQIDRLGTIWINKDGIKYEKNDFGSFNRISPIIIEKTCEKKLQVASRNDCYFDDMKSLEQLKANIYLKAYHPKLSDVSFDKINNTFTYDFSDTDHRTQFLIDHNMHEFIRGTVVENGKK